MAKSSPIRIRSKDIEEFTRLARNVRSKITRIKKNYGLDVSNEITVPKLTDFKTREEYNTWKEESQSFTSRTNLHYQFVKNKYDVVMTKVEKGQIERATKRAQRLAKQKQQHYQKLPFISQGEQQGTLQDRMRMVEKPGKITGIHVPPDFDFDTIESRRMLEKKKESMEKRGQQETFDLRQEKMQKNFIDMVEKAFNSEAQQLAEKIKMIPARDFFSLYLMYDEFDFEEYYQDAEGTISIDSQDINTMMLYVDKYNNGEITIPFKGRLN